ncbi:MAG: DegT/DnrJ/EryC1/StrS family aminotransferase, partial [Alphaproteobacteria bacterium]|nr:DegT/DnrJ/EryC1/StrS family aminotransferase [Alphaproteobacteria bacterium]
MPGFERIDYQEKEAAQAVFDEGGVLFAHGFDTIRQRFHVREFEAVCEERFNSRNCLAVTSGTAALKISLKALGVSQGDEVITQAFNFIATIEAILDCGAKPVIADIDDTLNMDPVDLEKRISPKTKVILPVHMLGVPVRMTEVMEVSNAHGLPVLEDNCESIGASYHGKALGTLGNVGVMSFDHGKMITTGEGGLILSNDEMIARYCREYHDHGHENNPELPRGRDTRKIYGFNHRITELQGAIGKVQLGKLDKM